MKYTAKLTSKGQVTVPKQVRERFALNTGDYLVFELTDDRIIVTKSPLQPTEDFDALADRIAQRLRDRGVTRRDVADAIRWAREKKS